MKPPNGGPSTGANRPGQISMDITRIKSLLGVFLSSTRRPTGTIIAPPIPCRTRSATKPQRLLTSAQAREARVNRINAEEKTRRLPNRSAIQPLMGMNTPSVNR
ncbi:hypothetical protein G6F35_018303 [Rhizopus arrhizus]|uniref:Uncharacterized protein n=1 Tax=Rhizopus delemar TaxID=936053 RepID=A0A9P6XSH8_9FUNG|nr:hypothetical protein G6F35_018303 [Rhizopus arrhizus]KAG1531286.1 hypothetical protein G6F50_016782 [Rhizopus delemar]